MKHYKVVRARLKKSMSPSTLLKASRRLLRIIESPYSAQYWSAGNGTTMPTFTGMVGDLRLENDPSTRAKVMFRESGLSNHIVVGVQFLIKHLKSFFDFMFILQHEKAHICLDAVFSNDTLVQTFKSAFGDRKSGWSPIINWSEDAYINRLVTKTNPKSKLCDKYYTTSYDTKQPDGSVLRKFSGNAALTSKSDDFLAFLRQSLEESVNLIDFNSTQTLPRATNDSAYSRTYYVDAINGLSRSTNIMTSVKARSDAIKDWYTTTMNANINLLYEMHSNISKDPNNNTYNSWCFTMGSFLSLLHSKVRSHLVGMEDFAPPAFPYDIYNDKIASIDSFYHNSDLRSLYVEEDKADQVVSLYSSFTKEFDLKVTAIKSTGVSFAGGATLDGVVALVNTLALDSPDDYTSSVYPPASFSPRDMFLMGAGVELNYYQRPISLLYEDGDLSDSNSMKPLVNLYVDVSGSMSAAYPIIPPIVRGLRNVNTRVYQFSSAFLDAGINTKVLHDGGVIRLLPYEDRYGLVEVTGEAPVLWSTGCTDFMLFAKHILDTQPRVAVILTDVEGDIGNSGILEALKSRVNASLLHLIVLAYTKDQFVDSMLYKSDLLSLGPTIKALK